MCCHVVKHQQHFQPRALVLLLLNFCYFDIVSREVEWKVAIQDFLWHAIYVIGGRYSYRQPQSYSAVGGVPGKVKSMGGLMEHNSSIDVLFQSLSNSLAEMTMWWVRYELFARFLSSD